MYMKFSRLCTVWRSFCEEGYLESITQDYIVTQATAFAERKGLVTLQPSSCCHRRNLM